MTLTTTCLAYCRARLGTLLKNEAGASLVEYGLLLALIAVACLAAVTLIGETTDSSLTSTASQLR